MPKLPETGADLGSTYTAPVFRGIADAVRFYPFAGSTPRVRRASQMALLLGLGSLCLGLVLAGPSSDAEGRARTLWMTDLYQPAEDPDDHYDLAVGMASTTYRPSLVVIDRSREEGRKPARSAVRELWRIAGGPRPRVIADARLRPQLDFLRSSPPSSVNVITLGSLSGLARLLRVNPRLLKRKAAGRRR